MCIRIYCLRLRGARPGTSSYGKRPEVLLRPLLLKVVATVVIQLASQQLVVQSQLSSFHSSSVVFTVV